MLRPARIIPTVLAVLALVCTAGSALAQEAHPAEPSAADHGHPHAPGHIEAEHSDVAHHADDHHGEYSLWADLPLWSGIAFIGFLIALKKLGLIDLLLSTMAERERSETEAISIAEGDLSKAQSLLRESRGRMEAMDETVRGILAEAERDSSYTREEITRLAEQEAQASVARARYEIERVRSQSLNDIFASLADKVVATTEARLKAELQPEDQDRLIHSTLDQLAVR